MYGYTSSTYVMVGDISKQYYHVALKHFQLNRSLVILIPECKLVRFCVLTINMFSSPFTEIPPKHTKG